MIKTQKLKRKALGGRGEDNKLTQSKKLTSNPPKDSLADLPPAFNNLKP
jgi:hypothetical protein